MATITAVGIFRSRIKGHGICFYYRIQAVVPLQYSLKYCSGDMNSRNIEIYLQNTTPHNHKYGNVYNGFYVSLFLETDERVSYLPYNA
jgi:hypothetical protein